MRHLFCFSRVERDSKNDVQEGVKLRHFRAKSQHLDTLALKKNILHTYITYMYSKAIKIEILRMRFDEGRPRLSLRASHGAQLLVEWAKTDLVHGGRCAQAFEVQIFF